MERDCGGTPTVQDIERLKMALVSLTSPEEQKVLNLLKKIEKDCAGDSQLAHASYELKSLVSFEGDDADCTVSLSILTDSYVALRQSETYSSIALSLVYMIINHVMPTPKLEPLEELQRFIHKMLTCEVEVKIPKLLLRCSLAKIAVGLTESEAEDFITVALAAEELKSLNPDRLGKSARVFNLFERMEEKGLIKYTDKELPVVAQILGDINMPMLIENLDNYDPARPIRVAAVIELQALVPKLNKEDLLPFKEEELLLKCVAVRKDGGWKSKPILDSTQKLSKFCKFGIAQQDLDEQDYCAAIYYHKIDARHYKISFTIFLNNELYSKVVQEQIFCYWQKKTTIEHHQKVEFMENQIELDIPFGPSQEGITSQNGEWRILSLSPPVITREEVDNFEKGKRIPSCQLMVKCEKENPSDLEYTVALKGARSPFNAFVIYIISASIGERHHQDEPADTDLEPNKKYHTTEMTYIELLRELSEAAADWEDIGMMLNLNQGSLNTIKGDFPNQSKKCFREMIKLWFKQVDPRPSWSALVEPLEILGYQLLAKSLKDKYCNT